MNKGNIGTFWCWLWGHKFKGVMPWEGKEDWVQYVYTDNCIRCGITRDELIQK